MNKSVIFGAIGTVLLGGAVVVIVQNSSLFARAHVYCSPDGTLSETMPIQSHRSYCIKSNASSTTYTAQTPSDYSFSIVDDEGNTLKDFAITHTKPMHILIVRTDLASFQHVHPEFDQSTGVFALSDLAFSSDGEYRIFADFAPQSGAKDPLGVPLGVTLSEDIRVGSTYEQVPIGSEEKTKTFGASQVSLSTHGTPMSGEETMLMFNLSQDGKAVTDLEEYLGALGHSVILKEGTLDFIHSHPTDVHAQNGTVSFMVTFPEAGKYKIFTQFQRDGQVFTTDFVLSVAQGTSVNDTHMPVTDHFTH